MAANDDHTASNSNSTSTSSNVSNGNIPNKTTTTTKKKNPLNDLIAGGCAGLVESSICHPLDTIKTRMQLRKNHVESVPQRIQHSLVEPALRLARHSMVEPAMRFRHSLMEPAGVAGGPARSASSATAASLLHEPSSSIRAFPAAAAAGGGHHRAGKTAAVVPRGTTVAPLGPIGTARRIIQREGFVSLYKGLTAVYTGAFVYFLFGWLVG
jgi:Mitochondrial carrier protein